LGPGPGEVGQGDLRSSTYDVTHKNSKTKNSKIFSLETRRLMESFEYFNSCLVLSAPELCPSKATFDPAVFERTA